MLNLKLFAAAAILALCGHLAHAANHLTCSNSSNVPDVSLLALNFDIEVAYSNTGSGGQAGKPTTSVSVVFPLNSQYAALSRIAQNGFRSSTCVLTESPSSSVSVEVTMKDVVFTSLKMVRGANFDVLAGSGPVVELSLAYSSYTLQTN
jgi:hypothetical protein